MARPTKLTDDVQKIICEAIENGATYKAAAEAAGVQYVTFNEWMKDSRKRYVEFSEAVMAANARFMTEAMKQIRAAGRKDWRALAWSLERRMPELFGQQNKLDVTSNGESLKVEFDYGKLITGIAGAASRPSGDNPTPSQDESHLHGQTVGKDDTGGDTGAGGG